MSSSQPLRISEFIIKGFKCIPYWENESKIVIPLEERPVEKYARDLYRFRDLGNFIVITGNNASGKSTFLQALFLVLGSSLKKIDYYPADINDKKIIMELSSKLLGLTTQDDLKYLFHRVKLLMIDYRSDEIWINLKLSAETDVSTELYFRKDTNKKDVIIKIGETSSLETFSPMINDIYVFHPIYPGKAQNHSGVFSVRGLGEFDVPIDMQIFGNSDVSGSFRINFVYKLSQIIGEDEKLPFYQLPIQYIPLGAYAISRLKLVRLIQKLKEKISNSKYSDIANIFIFEEPEIGLHPLLQRKFVRYLYEEFYENKNTEGYKESNIIIIVTQSDHVLNEAITLASENRDNPLFLPTFIDCCLKKVIVRDNDSNSTISCLYQKYYLTEEGNIDPYKNSVERNGTPTEHNICKPHSFIEALLSDNILHR